MGNLNRRAKLKNKIKYFIIKFIMKIFTIFPVNEKNLINSFHEKFSDSKATDIIKKISI